MINENKNPFKQYVASNISDLKAIDTSASEFDDGYVHACTVLAHNGQPAAQMLWNKDATEDSPEDGIVRPDDRPSTNGRWIFGWWADSALGGSINQISGADNIIVDNADLYNPVIKADLTKYPFTPQSSEPTGSEGQLYYDSLKYSLITQSIAGSSESLSLGREIRIRGRNNTGTTISKGQAVYVHSGDVEDTNDIVDIKLANANSGITSIFVVLAAEDILDGQVGEVISSGILRNVDTSSVSDGYIAYLDGYISGDMTETPPEFPNYECKIGRVLVSNASTGVIYVSPDVDPPLGSGGASATGLATFDISGINGVLNIDIKAIDNVVYESYFISTLVIPTENMVVNNLSFFVSQVGTITAGNGTGYRLGIYDPNLSDSPSDTLIAQTNRITTNFQLGINTHPLTSSKTLEANRPYLFAIQTNRINGAKIGYRENSGLSTAAPNHFARYQEAGIIGLGSSMTNPSGHTTSGHRIWIAAT